MDGKTCMITGANSGLGKAAALGLAKLGATVVMVCRNRARGEAALDEVKAESGNEAVDLMIADLSSQVSIRQLVDEFKDRHQRLHVLINNAGLYLTKRTVTADGIEAHFAVNYLATYLLTNLLLDTLRASAPARVVNVSGTYHRKGTINFDDLMSEQGYSAGKANAQAKLALVLFTYELARRLEGTGVTANTLHPGTVATGLVEKDPGYPPLLRLLYKLFKPFLASPEKGSRSPIYLATSPALEGVTGKYFEKMKETASSPESYDVATARRLWDVSADLTGLNA